VSNARPPVVGLGGSHQRVQWGSFDTEAALVKSAYVRWIMKAGAAAVVLPPGPPELAESLVDHLDGLILTGGSDVDPLHYGAEPGPHTQKPDPERDESELALLRAATDRDVPILAICRGIQLLNVARGGTLHQHLPDLVGHPGHSAPPGSYGRHTVRAVEGTRLATVMGTGPVTVPTQHHQAVDRIGAGLVVSARAEDETVEALEDPDRNFLIGVQWHPEEGTDPTLFRALVEAARSSVRSPS